MGVNLWLKAGSLLGILWLVAIGCGLDVTTGREGVPGDGTLPNWAKTVAELIGQAVVLAPLLGLAWLVWRKRLTAAGPGTFWVIAVVCAGALWMRSGTSQSLINAVLQAAVVGAALVVAYQGQLDGRRIFNRKSWVINRVVRGYWLFGILALLELLFVWVAESLGAWTGGWQASGAVTASPWPWLVPLVAPLAAALWEEAVFRKLADVWLMRVLRSSTVTAVVASVLWGWTHLGYEVSPWYVRLLELGLVIGPVTFWAYRRYGLAATMTGHFLYNSFVYGMLVVREYGDGYVWVYLYLLLPAAVVGLNRMRIGIRENN